MSSRERQNRFSRKAQALHRVYVYLRIMRESTDLRCANLEEISSSPQDLAWLSKPLCFLDRIETSDNWLQDSIPRNDVDMSAFEFVYGIPFQLLTLMSKTSELIRRKKTFNQNFPTSAMPQILSVMCDDLELEILDWPVDRVIGDLQNLPIEKESQNLIDHQTKAFHQAIIIYFSRLVRSVHRMHLQPYVENIIDSLEAVEIIKHEANLATGCILWSGFIGAAEAIDTKLQSRYLQWFRSTQFYGLGAYDTACEVVLEVWERRKAGKDQSSCSDWPDVIESKDIRLMLT